MATFGQLAAVADRHRAEVQEALRRPDISVLAGRPSSINELGRLAQVLTRYTDRIAHGFGLPGDDGASTRNIARQAGVSLRHATAYLDMSAVSPEQGTNLARNLRASAVALGCGLDLLFTHLPSPDSGRQPTSVASVIAAPDVAGDLFRLISSHANTAGQLALKAGAARRPGGQFLLRAAAITAPFAHGHEADTGLRAVALPDIPDRIPPEVGEDQDQLLAGIDASVRRLDASQADGSVTTWRYLARAATITHELDRHLVCMLRLRLEALGDSQTADQLWPVIKTMNTMAIRWRTLARTWNDLTAGRRDPEIGPVVDASDLVIRLGRLGYADPAWKPGHRMQPTNTDPARLAPTLSDVTRIGLTVVTTLSTCNQITAQQRRAINDIVRSRRLGITHQNRYGRPRLHDRPTDIGKLRKLYPANAIAGREVVSQLAHLIRGVMPDPGPETTLALRSAALPAPVALASADCPTSIFDDGGFSAAPPASSPLRRPAHPLQSPPHL